MATSETPLLNGTSSDKQRLLGALVAFARSEKITDDGCLPAIVLAYDRAANIATVKPLMQWVDMKDEAHSRHPLVGINVLSMGGGGFHVNFPIKPGDLGWIVAMDRDISLFKESLKETRPNTGRLHKFEDGWFVPDVFRKYTINSEDSDSMVIQSTDGATRISISNGNVKITAPVGAIIDTPTLTATGDLIVQKNLKVNMSATVDQTLTATAGAHLPAGTTVGGTNVSNHGHISSAPGTRTAGGMIT